MYLLAHQPNTISIKNKKNTCTLEFWTILFCREVLLTTAPPPIHKLKCNSVCILFLSSFLLNEALQYVVTKTHKNTRRVYIKVSGRSCAIRHELYPFHFNSLRSNWSLNLYLHADSNTTSSNFILHLGLALFASMTLSLVLSLFLLFTLNNTWIDEYEQNTV